MPLCMETSRTRAMPDLLVMEIKELARTKVETTIRAMKIKQSISDTINGVGMPGDKSLLTRVVEQITGNPALFKGHQDQINGYRNRLRKLKKEWKNDDCPDPDNPPFGTNQWITQTDGSNLKNLLDKYQQALKDLKNLGIGAAAAAAIAQAGEILAQIGAFIEGLGGMVPVIVP